jgi:hypothetical protein
MKLVYLRSHQQFILGQWFCLTPEHRGIALHYTSPPSVAEEFAEFCARMTRRYAPVNNERRARRAIEVGGLETAAPC